MKPLSLQWTAWFFLLLSTASLARAALPVVVWHGFFDTCRNDKSVGHLRQAVHSTLPGVFFHSICIGGEGVRDAHASVFGSIDDQISEVCASLTAIPELAGGFNAIGISQGGLLFRGYVQRCNHPPVRTLITLGSPHAGMAALPACTNAGPDSEPRSKPDVEPLSEPDSNLNLNSWHLAANKSFIRLGVSDFNSSLSIASGNTAGNTAAAVNTAFRAMLAFSSGSSSSLAAWGLGWAARASTGGGGLFGVCGVVRPFLHVMYHLPWVQHAFLPAQYFRLWRHMDAYLDRSGFLADINNERREGGRNEAYVRRIKGLERLVLVRWEDERMISPAESPWFGSHDRSGQLLPLHQQPLYREDWLGLRHLQETGRLEFKTMPGTHGVIMPAQFAHEFVKKYLQ